MPRILRIINRLNIGGPTYNASYLTKYLEPDYETLLLAGMKDDSEASSEFIVKKLGIEPNYIDGMKRSINPIKDYVAYKQIKRVIEEFKPDIVHTHAAKAGALGRLAAHHCKVPVIIHTFHGHIFHSYFHPLKTRVFLEIERYLAKISTHIIAISNLQKQELADEFNICSRDKIKVIPLGFDLSRFQENIDNKRKCFRQKHNLEDDEIAIGIIGRLVPIKNHEMFLKAFKSVVDNTEKRVRAFIIGDGEKKEELLNFTNSLALTTCDRNFEGAKHHVTFTSWIRDIDEALAGLDIVALTSFNEGTPVSLIEAQAAKKAIVTTKVGGIEDVVQAGITALVSSSNDLLSFTFNMSKLVDDDIFRINMAQTGYDLVKNKFGYVRLVKDVKMLYDSTLTKEVNSEPLKF